LLLAELEATPAARRARLEAGLDFAASLAGRMDAPGDASHFMHLARDLLATLARVRVEHGDRRAGAAVLLESRLMALARLTSARLLARDPQALDEVRRAETEAAEKIKSSCDGLSDLQRKACVTERLASEARATQAQRAFFARARGVDPEPAEVVLARAQARLGPREAILLSEVGPGAAAVALVRADGIDFAWQRGLPSAWDRQLEGLEVLWVAGPVDPDPRAPRQVVLRWVPVGRPEAPPPAWGPPVVVADTRDDLSQTRAQAVRQARALGVEPLLGAQATVVALRAALAAHPRRLVFMGHGSMEDRDLWSSRLRLADGDLDMEALITGDLAADVVVLDGCATGDAAGSSGVGLADALVLRGSRAVLASTATIADGSTEAMVQAFLRAEESTADPVAAYREAVRAGTEAGEAPVARFRLWARMPSD
jgi:hypothetical protein